MSDDPWKTPMEQAAIAMREQYLSFRRAGFGRWEAVFLVAAIAVLPPNGGSDEDA